MRDSDFDNFTNMLAAIGDMKSKPQSEWALGVWWKALSSYDFEAVEDALIRHVQNPDNGQYMPVPADVIKLIQGNSIDSALVAWAKVDRAVRVIGPWGDVAFDDPLIHRVIKDMGGWVELGKKTDKEWPFTAKEFENRYRGYRTRADLTIYPHVLIGSFNMHNASASMATQPPMLIGDASKAEAVMLGGSSQPMIPMQLAVEAVMTQAPHIASSPKTDEEIIDINGNPEKK